MRVYELEEFKIGMQIRDSIRGRLMHVRGFVDERPIFRCWNRYSQRWDYYVWPDFYILLSEWKKGIKIIGWDK